MEETTTNLSESTFDTSGIISKTFFVWILPIIKKNHEKKLTIDNLSKPPAQTRSELVAPKLQTHLLEANSKDGHKVSFRSASWKLLRKGFFISSFMYFLKYCILCLFNSIVLWILVNSLRDGITTYTYLYAAGLCLSLMTSTLLHHHMYFYAQCKAMALRVATCATIYKKVLMLSKANSSQITNGHLLNIISADIGKFEQVSGYFMCLISVPFLLTASISILLWLYGVSCLAGISVYILMALFQLYQGKLFKSLRNKKSTYTDERLKTTGAILSSMRIVKLYNWEKPMQDLIASFRKKELKIMETINALRAFNMTLFYTSAKIALFVTIFTDFIVFGNTPKADTVFVVFSLFNVIRISLAFDLPGAIERTVETLVSVQRIQKVLSITTAETKDNTKQCTDEEEIIPRNILLENITAVWEKDDNNFKLEINKLSLNGPVLCVITGRVGSGKTSFLMSLLREMHVVKGTMSISGSIAYVPQESWLFPGTIRQNILFGKPYDETWYNTVLYACVLHQDLETMQYKDLTNVGDKGVTLSGGQKARINLARAIYRNADIYVLDDPLSAVDSKVANHLILNCICGLLKDKLRFLATHHSAMLKHLSIPHRHISLKKGLVEMKEIDINNATNKDVSEWNVSQMNIETPIQDVEKMNKKNMDKSTQEIAVTSAGMWGYNQFFAKGNGIFLITICAALNIASQIFFVSGDILISFWANATYPSTNENNFSTVSSEKSRILDMQMESPMDFLNLYVTITSLLLVTAMSRAFLFFRLCLKSSTALHNKMLNGILQTKIFFFDHNPVGRILNRFSKDMETIDDLLPTAYLEVVTQLLMLSGVIVILGFTNYWLLLPIYFLMVMVIFLGLIFFKISRNLKKMEAIARSSVYTHFNSSMEGKVTIRALNANDTLHKEFDNHNNIHSAAHFMNFAFLRWFSVWLDFSFNILTGIVTFTMLVVGGTTGTDLGLVLSTLFSVGSTIPWVTRLAAELQTQMVSYERILQYTKLEKETGYNIPAEYQARLTKDNIAGKVNFSQVSLCYEQTEQYVLKSVTFTIQPGEKVGVVGRTGAGKSSLIAALFRLADIEGTISIDDIDISEMSLEELRQNIAVIPQDPILFTSSVRYNLDPFGKHSDENLWDVLESVQLKDVIKLMPDGLSTLVTEGGSNFSTGQRQLLCLARVLLRSNKIVILDEATSSVDMRTQELINTIIKKKFSSCTVITIAHRLDTIRNMDKVIVMDNGSLIEFGTPKCLLRQQSGKFRKLIEQAKNDLKRKISFKQEETHYCTRL